MIISLSLFLYASLYSVPEEKYVTLYNNKQYDESLKEIDRVLSKYYGERVEAKRIPSEFISMDQNEDVVDLEKIHRNRKVKGFLIEKNLKMHKLHLYAGRIMFQKKKLDDSLNHYYQSLRYKNVENGIDDRVYYEISHIYLTKYQRSTQKDRYNYFIAYLHTLESAYYLNQTKYSYSLELGKALYRTSHKLKSVFHLVRYTDNTSDTIKPQIYFLIGNLYEDLKKYLKTEEYYVKYLKEKKDDGNIHFALGVLTVKHTGHYSLGARSLNKALELLPTGAIFRRSKSHELLGKIYFSNLEFNKALESYLKTVKYHDSIQNDIDVLQKEADEIQKRINKLKYLLLNEKAFDNYQEYQIMRKKKGRVDYKIDEKRKAYKKIHKGKVLWNIATIYERQEKYKDAIKYYRRAIYYEFKPNRCREKIIKLQLKIKRGY